MKKTKNRTKSQILTSFSSGSILLDSNETPWSHPVPIQAPSRSAKHSHTAPPRKFVPMSSRKPSLYSTESMGLTTDTLHTRQSTQLI